MASQMVKLLWEVELCQYESTIFYGFRKYKDEKHNIFSYFTYEDVALPTSTMFLPQLLVKVFKAIWNIIYKKQCFYGIFEIRMWDQEYHFIILVHEFYFPLWPKVTPC